MLVILIGVPVVMAVVLWYNNRRGLLTDAKHISRYGTYHYQPYVHHQHTPIQYYVRIHRCII